MWIGEETGIPHEFLLGWFIVWRIVCICLQATIKELAKGASIGPLWLRCAHVMRGGIVHGVDDPRFMVSRDTDTPSGLVVPLLDKFAAPHAAGRQNVAMASTSTLIKCSRLPE